MAKPFVFCLVILSSLFLSCSSEDTHPGYVFTQKIDSMDMESFKFPDSIDTKLIIATYYDSENAIQTLFVYDNEFKNSVRKIDYLKNDSVVIDQLEILKLNEFRSSRFNVDYVIEKSTVTKVDAIPWDHSGPPTSSKEFKRTDRD